MTQPEIDSLIPGDRIQTPQGVMTVEAVKRGWVFGVKTLSDHCLHGSWLQDDRYQLLTPATWSTAVPTEPGWYWRRYGDASKPGGYTDPVAVNLRLHNGALCQGLWQISAQESVEYWSVPITTPPTDTESKEIKL
jgi:hypothetical protein